MVNPRCVSLTWLRAGKSTDNLVFLEVMRWGRRRLGGSWWQLVAKEWKTYEELHGKWGQNLGERWTCHFSCWGTFLLQELLLAGDSSKVRLSFSSPFRSVWDGDVNLLAGCRGEGPSNSSSNNSAPRLKGRGSWLIHDYDTDWWLIHGDTRMFPSVLAFNPLIERTVAPCCDSIGGLSRW